MSKNLVIVESPTKAKTITKFLGKDYAVTSSYGHIRDLPNGAKEIPAKYKKEAWSRLGINVEDDFDPLYVIPADKKKRIKELKELAKKAEVIYLATDEDREGESISWHLLEVLKPKVPVKRMVFHEITKPAIKAALAASRDVDMDLVRAQETRRLVDRLYGYTLSPLLWRKMAPRLSAGRVQSVALRLLVERERERIAFRNASYWDLKGRFAKSGSMNFSADIITVDGKRVAGSKDFDPADGKLKKKADILLLDQKAAEDLQKKVSAAQAKAVKVEEKPYTTQPPAPFTTSTLQQEGNRKLRYSAKRTMGTAQKLYENGFITYMRTDSTSLSAEAVNGARTIIGQEFGPEFLPEKPRVYKTKVKNAQEAHEAIRPAGSKFATVSEVKKVVGDDGARLYELIRKRMLACQMKAATGKRQSVVIEAAGCEFRAAGKTIEFPGFLRAYVEGSDDPAAELADQENILPTLTVGDNVDTKKIEALEHTTQAPPRYTEGSLIKELEKRGIGRPSTWASVVNLVLSRDYAFKKGTALVPTFLAQALIGLLEEYFTDLVDYSFTAQLEDDLDAISRGEEDNIAYLHKFYFGDKLKGIKKLVDEGLETIDPRIVCGIPIGKNEAGQVVEVRIGRYGPFLTDSENRSSLPEGLAPDEMTLVKAQEILTTAAKGPESLGIEEESGLPVFLKTGRYGPYVQLGEKSEEVEKPKMASLLKNMMPDDVDLETAVGLLSLPRKLGVHPIYEEEIVSANGRFGPYLKAGTETRSLNLEEYSPVTITREQAIKLLNEPKKKGRRGPPKALKELGKHPSSEKNIVIKTGPYGPYVSDGKLNAAIPKDKTLDQVDLKLAVELLEERANK